jgi:hypothetical protein
MTEIQLRKPAREVFNLMKKTPGCVLRKHKKALSHQRIYFRLMGSLYNPVKNFPPGKVKQLLEMDLLEKSSETEYRLKDGYELIDKRKKKTKAA